MELFKLFHINFHANVTKFVTAFWKNHKKRLDGYEILQFLNLLYNYHEMNLKFGLKDPRYVNSFRHIVNTFSIRTFNGMMPMILTVLEDMKKNHIKEKETICVSHGPIDVFRFINEVFDCYAKCDHPDVLRAVLGLIYR